MKLKVPIKHNYCCFGNTGEMLHWSPQICNDCFTQVSELWPLSSCLFEPVKILNIEQAPSEKVGKLISSMLENRY